MNKFNLIRFYNNKMLIIKNKMFKNWVKIIIMIQSTKKPFLKALISYKQIIKMKFKKYKINNKITKVKATNNFLIK